MNLFNEQTGFRLQRLELYNWGTFNGQIWTMSPDCQTAVLTGANGSGKSTVVDALLTLLVENRQRNYNLASGANSSRERNERTYVTGQYSRARQDTGLEGKAKALRGIDSHTVLLGVFYDESQDRTVTLAQVLWLSGSNRVEKRYYVADSELNIEQHFPQRQVTARDLPRGAQAFGSTFGKYQAAARKALGLNGRPKALDLFNETVAVKDIPSLNTFVRDHMLDKGDPEARVEALRTQYRELNDAHTAIQRAAHQFAILQPLVEAAEEYRHYEQQIARYEAARELVPFYVADKAQGLLKEAIQALQQQRHTEESRLNVVTAERDRLRREIEDVRIAIAQDSVGQMQREIEGKLPLIEADIKNLRRAAERYNADAELLNLPTYQHEADFYANRTHAESAIRRLADEVQELESQRADYQLQQRDLHEQETALTDEINYLRDNLSNIPARLAMIRNQLCATLGLEVDVLPFVGELLKVRDGENAWEGAIERLLNSFAQAIVIPEEHFEAAQHYITNNNLQTQLVYQRVDPDRPAPYATESHTHHEADALVYDKLEIKRDTTYGDWLAAQLIGQYTYTCSQTVEEWAHLDRAVTQSGHIKHSPTRYEKDDRHDLQDRRQYVLGWDNREKLRQLEDELVAIQRTLRDISSEIEGMSITLKRKRRDSTALENLLKIQTFAEIDWRSRQVEFDRLQQQLEDLRQQAYNLQRLEQQRRTLEQELQVVEKRQTTIQNQIATIDYQIAEHHKRLQDAERKLRSATAEHERLWEQVHPILEDIDRDPLTIATIGNRENELNAFLQRAAANFKGQQNNHQARILDAMNTFRRDYPDVGTALDANIAALEAYVSIHQRLETDDLPRYETRFKQMLDRTVARGIMTFSANLEEQERKIDRSIAELNESLAQVDYSNGSIIRLIAERSTDPEIQDFRNALRACIPDTGDDSHEELERAYNRIKDLIERFDDDPNWMRRVIDVRRWRVFAAEQVDTEGVQIDYYNDSSGKSGGQKAKLAYTILASAIAYQYGLQDTLSGERSFRLVVIDEAFSKLDDDNARFAMQLFKHLGLQLLVVTPMQQLHIIEDYVRAYHVVVNNDEGSNSRLFNLTQAEYRERRREFKTQSNTA